ncbi:MAG: redox-sensing transcriptional repressor Rex [Chloroflexi bacterium]|jgi:redox-sensing transcriptional repressor|nr:redox-sensing transcriptional repressor Rex [Chloroflexota bacterium]MBT3671305.1 redox-sensing transcriptional repressor Rex [Chloroflexota bacterium]MBT4001752.1 redox-sensing transcriptional repressor Rex [Chloroflexota bacterium]MBT4304236.1 redox-sensing transcriptional repressor Rex [Chloroflexota bacterium]MBT4534255.1 redox-sensing transcriptional repressor Rex [Chloroflexota bacterium]
MKKPIPDIVIGRLPVYLRALQHMMDAGRSVTSSQELGERLGISAAQIRKDLSQFGEFGKQGTGYTIEFLAQQIQAILKIEKVWEIALIGAGDMGNALAAYQGFNQRGFHISKIFDSDPNKIGKQIGDYKVLNIESMESEIKKANIKIAMLAVPASVAQEVTDKLVDAGIKAILNYAPVSINVPEGVRKQYIDPAVHLQRMSYYLK